MSDIRLSLRFLLKKRGWTAAAVLTVAIGIAGSTLAFSLVDRALWRPLGFAGGGELVTLYARSGNEYSTIAWRDYVAFHDALHDAERLTEVGLLGLAATGGLSGLLYETEPRDPLTLAGAAVVLGLAAMLAGFGPARRAARVDPATVLRAE